MGVVAAESAATVDHLLAGVGWHVRRPHLLGGDRAHAAGDHHPEFFEIAERRHGTRWRCGSGPTLGSSEVVQRRQQGLPVQPTQVALDDPLVPPEVEIAIRHMLQRRQQECLEQVH